MTSTQMELGLDLGLPQDAVDVNGRVWFRDLDGNRAVFVDQDPFYCYPLDDPVLHRFCAVQLVEAGLVKVCEICPAFEIHDRAFSRYRSRFREQGIAGLVPGKVGRKPLETASLAPGIVQRYQSGKSTRDIANELAADHGFWLGDAFASGGSHGEARPGEESLVNAPANLHRSVNHVGVADDPQRRQGVRG